MANCPHEITKIYASAECLYSAEEVSKGLDRLAGTIQEELGDSYPLLLCIMLGAIVTTGQLVTRLQFPLQIDYLHVTRYKGKTKGGSLDWHRRPDIPMKDRTVLVVDDILDEGHTLAAIVDYCTAQGAERVLSAVLVEKQHTRKRPDIKADFVALNVEDRYVFGYGMDYHNHLRNLPGIYAVGHQE